MKRKTSFGLITALLVVGLLLPLFAKLATAKSINIGYTTDFSGHTARFGITEAPVVEMIVKEVNAAGGINGRRINLITVDNNGDLAKMLGHLKMFKEREKCSIIIQGVDSSLGLAAKGWAEKNHVPVISPDSGADTLFDSEGKAWWFRTVWSVSAMAEGGLNRFRNLGCKTFVFAGSPLTASEQTLAAAKKFAPEYGLEYLGDERSEPGIKDLTIQAMKLQAKGADAVLLGEYEAEIGVWARAFKSIGWNPHCFQAWGMNMSNAIQLYPAGLLEGWECGQMVDSENPVVIEIWEKTAAYTGKRVEDELRPRTYDLIMITLEALRVADDPDDPLSVRDALYKIKDFPISSGVKGRGQFEIGKNQLITGADAVIYVAKGGKLVKVKD